MHTYTHVTEATDERKIMIMILISVTSEHKDTTRAYYRPKTPVPISVSVFFPHS